ncbi:MAG: hypothetical protein FJY20_06440 [Bacteroidetes bacterium]|nr:hypothetical protein [Bacteroidota bacterium]
MQLFAGDTQKTKPGEKPSQAGVIYFRLIALWVLCEAMLGGIIHGFKIPVSGLVVGSSAVICICLIGWYVPARGAIIKATLIVAVFKMMLSPQTPPTAYIAVFFQGILGEFLLRNKKYYRAACVTLAVLALLESALQRVLVLTLIYGKDFWEVVNSSIYRLGGSADTDYSYFIILWYVLIHLIVGAVVGLWAGFLPQRIQLLNGLQKKYHIKPAADTSPLTAKTKRKRPLFRLFFFIIWIVLLALWLQSVLHIGNPFMPSHISLRILVRSAIIILTWYFLVGPLLKRALQKWLQQKKQQSAWQVQQVVDQLPFTRHLVTQSWQMSSGKKGINRIMLSCRIILANTFHSSYA